MRYIIQFSPYRETLVSRLSTSAHGWDLHLCAGATRRSIDVAARGLEAPVAARKIVEERIPPTAGGVQYRRAGERDVHIDLAPAAGDEDVLVVVGFYAGDRGAVTNPGVAEVRDGGLFLGPHPGLKEVLWTTSGAGWGLFFLASLRPGDTPLSLATRGTLYSVHVTPPSVTAIPVAEWLAAQQEFTVL